jgi:broad specificity phosphatase PhoE
MPRIRARVTLSGAPGGETLAEVLDRAWRAVEHIAGRHAGGSVAAVSHRVVCKLVVCRALGVGEAGFWRVRLDTASVSVLEQRGDDWTVTGVNDTCHLRSLGAGDAADF